MRVIGTAGHVDHGKSTLVQRLTSIDPDRLAEEKQRQMTIDLGFAWLTLPNNETIGIVDVPGHQDFIENMLAGVGGIDAVMLVIAADEGVMPQTREHLAILDLLSIPQGLIVLTKCDLISDPEWFDLVEQDIGEIASGTCLQDAEILRISAHTGAGIADLTTRIGELLRNLPQTVDYRVPRLNIDRVFSMSGFGTVVTGTLLGGSLKIGAEIEIQPGAHRGRVRGLQSYKKSIEIAQPGSRVAVNITGVDRNRLGRGQVLTLPGQLQPTLLVDVHFRHLTTASKALKHNAEVKLFVGTAETSARVRLLDDKVLPAGQEAWLQLRLAQPLALSQGDRFILRYPSPAETIGGGVIVNPQPGRRWKRFQPDLIAQLTLHLEGSPADRIAQLARQSEPVNRQFLQKQLGLGKEELETGIDEAIQNKLLVELLPGKYIALDYYQNLVAKMMIGLEDFHRHYPLRRGIPREQLRQQLGLQPTTLDALVEHNPQIVAEADVLRLADYSIQFSAEQSQQIVELLTKFDASLYTPPSFSEAQALVGEELLAVLIERSDLVRVSDEVLFSAKAYQQMLAATLDHIDAHGSISARDLRDQFQTSRKYAISLLEYLDHQKITRREGDMRVRGPRS